MIKSPEILSSGEKAPVKVSGLSLREKFEKSGFNTELFSRPEFKDLEERHEKSLTLYEGGIDNNENKLEERINLNIEAASLSIEEQLQEATRYVESVEQKVSTNEETLKEKLNPAKQLEKGLAEQTGLKWLAGSGIGVGLISMFTSIKKEFGVLGDFFAGMLSKIPGFGFLKTALNEEEAKEESEVEKTNTSEETSKEISPEEEAKEESEVVVDKIDTIENRKSVYDKLGSFIVREMGGKQIRASDNPSSAFEIIGKEGLSVSELKDYNPSEEDMKNTLGGKKITKEQFDLVKASLIGPEMQIIFDSLFSTRNLQHLANKKRSKEMIDNLGLDVNNFDWRSIEVSKLLILLPMTLSGFTYLSANNALGFANDQVSKIINFTKNAQLEEILKEFKSEVKEFEENVMSAELGTKVAAQLDSNTLTLTKEQLGMEGEQIEKFLAFRDFIVTDVLKNTRYNLGMETDIIDSFSLGEVFQLYILFGGNTPDNIENIDAFNSNVLYTWIFSVLQDSPKQGKYTAKIQDEIVNQEFIKESDTGLMQVMIIKIMEESFDKFFRIGQKAGSAGLEAIKNNPKESALLGLAVFLVNKVPVVRGFKLVHKLLLLGGGAGAYTWLGLSDNVKKHAEKTAAEQGPESDIYKVLEEIKSEISEGDTDSKDNPETTNQNDKDQVNNWQDGVKNLWEEHVPDAIKDVTKGF